MSDVIIARMIFPNDPTNCFVAHQMFVAYSDNNRLVLYSISSILGKERRVYGNDRDDYFVILPPNDSLNGFNAPSFIDCTKAYEIIISPSTNVAALSSRNISSIIKKHMVY